MLRFPTVLMMVTLLVPADFCKPKPPEVPPEVPEACPATCPEGQSCTDPAKGCQPIPAPAECPATCPTGQTCLDPIVGCEPTQPEAGCSIPADEGWVAVVPDPGPYVYERVPVIVTTRDRILAAQEAIGFRCARPSSESVDLLVGELLKLGVCSRRYGGDMLMVQRPDGLHEEWDVVLASGCWSQQWSYTWIQSGETPPTQPPSTISCTSPLPDPSPAWWWLRCEKRGEEVDCTPWTWQGSAGCTYCKAIGMGEIGGVQRCGCPMRNECPGFKCEERAACELYVAEGPLVLEAKEGASCVRTAATKFLANGGSCRLCNPAKTVCSGWY